MSADPNPRLQRLWSLVRTIPAGHVTSYGALGQLLMPRVSGLLVGKWMALAPEDVPWWRVVGADGSLKTWKRGPEVAEEQIARLQDEGVALQEGRVPASAFLAADLLAEIEAGLNAGDGDP